MSKSVDYTKKVLEVKNLKKYFFHGTGKNKLTIPAVDDVSFDVYKREVFGLVGESGCGKTTTGRTIIKLYKPTDGTVDLNGERVTAGYATNLVRIKEIKRKLKEDILSYDEYKYKKYLINQDAKKKAELTKVKITQLKKEERAELIKTRQPINDYHDEKYNLKNRYQLDVENVKYNYKLDRQTLIEKTINTAKVEYDELVAICNTSFRKQEDGLRDSAALSKEVIEGRLARLKERHQEELKSLKETYEPLILEAEKNRLTKKDIMQELSEIKAIKDKNLQELKAKYHSDLSAIFVPNREEINQKVAQIKASYREKIQAVKDEITIIFAKAKVEIASLEIKESNIEENKEKIEELKRVAKEKIEVEKATIRYIKQTNKSKESLEASRGMQMIFQDPIASLNPRMTVKEIVGEGLIIQKKYSDKEIDERVGEALELVGLSRDYVTRYPHEFSGGQRQRIGVARALIMNPEFIIADEPISALDVSIRAQVINLLSELMESLGLTILFIAHDLSVVRFFCDRIAVMYYGKIVELASSEELFANPMHPYTISLISAIPQPDPDYEKGRIRIHYDPRMHNYLIDKPSLKEIAPGHLVYANEAEFKVLKEKYAKAKKTVNKEAL